MPSYPAPADVTVDVKIDKPVIFFDGECNLCNGFVDFILKIDPTQKFYLAPLQGPTAKQYLPPLPPKQEDWAIAYFDGQKTYFASEACLEICKKLGGIWSMVALTQSLPISFRDFVYSIVATNRYNWFGQTSCRTITFDGRSPFLP